MHGPGSSRDLDLTVPGVRADAAGSERDANVSVARRDVDVIARAVDADVAIAGARAQLHAFGQRDRDPRGRRPAIPVVAPAPALPLARAATAPHAAERHAVGVVLHLERQLGASAAAALGAELHLVAGALPHVDRSVEMPDSDGAARSDHPGPGEQVGARLLT